MKPVAIVFCGENGEAGKAIAASLRGEFDVIMGSAEAFRQVETECQRIEFTPDVPEHIIRRITMAYGLGPGVEVYKKVIEDVIRDHIEREDVTATEIAKVILEDPRKPEPVVKANSRKRTRK